MSRGSARRFCSAWSCTSRISASSFAGNSFSWRRCCSNFVSAPDTSLRASRTRTSSWGQRDRALSRVAAVDSKIRAGRSLADTMCEAVLATGSTILVPAPLLMMPFELSQSISSRSVAMSPLRVWIVEAFSAELRAARRRVLVLESTVSRSEMEASIADSRSEVDSVISAGAPRVAVYAMRTGGPAE